MKILAIFPFARPISNEITYGGGEKRFIEIIRRWSELGNKVNVITSITGKKLLRKFELKIPALSYTPIILPAGVEDFLNIKRMLKKIPNENYDFIYCSGEPFVPVITSILAKKRLKVPVVASINLFNENETKFTSSFKMTFYPERTSDMLGKSYFKSIPRRLLLFLKINLRNLFLKKVDLIFSVTSYLKQLLTKLGIDEERIYTVGGGIDYSLIESVKVNEKKYDACFLGAIHPRKGIFDLIYAWKEIVKRRPKAKLLIIGHGAKTYVNSLKKLIDRANLRTNVIMVGFVDGKRKYELMKSAKIFIFPSYSEGFAQAICEALACELPVIAYDLPVYNEWYEDVILYVKRGDINEMTAKILHLLDNENLRAKIGKRGATIARRYNWDDIAKYELKIIKKIFYKQ
ncbi:MAG: glycosyltransferase family 4 protein [Thermoproteales archaeon]|nr:glycosyltransferase family 4 protein [Thermoproteales archaeon]